MAETVGARNLWKVKEDIIRESQTNIKDPESVKKWLLENDLAVKGEGITMSMIVSALQQLSSGWFIYPKDMVSGMRAVVICLEEAIQDQHTNIAMDMIMEQVEDIVKEAKAAIESLVGEVKTVMEETEKSFRAERNKQRNGS